MHKRRESNNGSKPSGPKFFVILYGPVECTGFGVKEDILGVTYVCLLWYEFNLRFTSLSIGKVLYNCIWILFLWQLLFFGNMIVI